MRKIILKHFLAPGDVLMLTAVVRDIHLTFPNEYQTDVRTPYPALWENNPYLTPLQEDDDDVEVIDCIYPLIHQSNQLPYHFIHAFRLFLSEKLGVQIQPHAFKGDIHLTEQEKSWTSQVDEITGQKGTRFWIIVSGGKTDFTAKWWDPVRYQRIVDHFKDRILFVQCGGAYDDHTHKPLSGVIDLVGQTDIRQMVRLMHHADGVVCPVTMFMHLAAAVEARHGRSTNRPCVVVAGGREPAQWEAYPHHQFLHTNGCLPCCDNGGCWKSRTVPLGDGQEQDQSLCLYPVATTEGIPLPKCLDMIGADDVIAAVERCLKFDTYAWRTIYAWHEAPADA
ncbi:MAG: glycosyltransferase family 9 protein [Janthinobacterium lividum]